MRIVVVGQSGNVGTAVLRALLAAEQVDSVLGVARRLPDRTAAPYRDAEWAPVDISDPDEESVADRLATLFRGADAVVHLAWLIQPNRERDLLRRTNVDGTRRVAEAVVRAGVPHLVVASSVAAYTPVDDDEPRRESWQTTGIPTSHYSVDKAAQERVLDELERDHPEVAVARLRTALVFQGDAGHEIVRYFVGPFVPLSLLHDHRLPVAPLPAGVRAQAVHADDAADAYLRVVLERATGAFNVAAHDLLRASDLATILDHGRLVELPPRAVRAALALAYSAHAVPTDPGWVDMAMGVPVMDTTRATSELGWQPRHSAAEALEELVAGMAEGRGLGSAPMRPSPRVAVGPPTLPPDERDAAVPPEIDRHLFGLYLSDHLTGATVGLDRIERMVENYRDSPFHADLAELAEQIRAERQLYRTLLATLGIRRRRYRQVLAAVAERAGRLKLNGRLLEQSPLTVLLEVELMRSAVMGKLGGWRTLEEYAGDVGLDPDRFRALAELADRQIAMLDRLHEHARERTFRRTD